MTRIIDLTGQKFNKLTVISRAENSRYGQARWYCKCDCGNEELIIAASHDIKSGHTRSCGCVLRDVLIERNFIHGHTNKGKHSITYSSWTNMINRCTNPNYAFKHRYEERKIDVCEEWFDFKSFIRDMGERPSKKHTLDRIDNNLGYFKENCKWSTAKEQCRNRNVDHRNKSGHHGVYKYKDGIRFFSTIYVDGKNKHLGIFETIDEAIRERKEAEQKYWGKSS